MVYLLADKGRAEDYGDDVVAVRVQDDDLLIDLDMPGAVGVDVETANAITGNEFDCASEYAAAGFAVCAHTHDVTIA